MMSVSCLVNLDWCLMGLDQFRPIALKNTAVKLLAAGAVFLFVRGPEDLWVYAFVWSLATLLGCLSCWTTLRGKVRRVPVSFPAAMKHFPPCALLFVSVLAVNVFRTMDRSMWRRTRSVSPRLSIPETLGSITVPMAEIKPLRQ